ncbi:MAG: hypothetical protein KAW52_00265 [candidate division Zixibacteria bacterium]|nr:hypothetical protein [candidate division Zixibacteria bacterium]
MSTPEGQFNRNIKTLTNFLMQQKLMGQRMGGYGELETQRHENMMTRMEAAFTDQLSRDPVMQRHRALVFKAQKEGKDVASLVEAMKKDAMKLAKVSFDTLDKPWTEETAQAATLLTEKSMVDMVGQAATSARQEKQIKEVAVPGLIMRGAEAGLEAERIGVQKDRLKLDWQKLKQKPAEEQNKEMRAIVKDTINFLEAEGVKGKDINEQIKNLFGSGKIPDPLSPENRGKAFTYLMEIWINLAKGKTLTSSEEKFLIQVRNTRAIETPIEEGGIGGLPSPALGGESEEQIRQNMINQIAEYIKGKGVDPAQAISLATEFYDTRIRK